MLDMNAGMINKKADTINLIERDIRNTAFLTLEFIADPARKLFVKLHGLCFCAHSIVEKA